MEHIFVVSHNGSTPEAVRTVLQRLHPGASIITVRFVVHTAAQLRRVAANYCAGRVYLLGNPPRVRQGEPVPSFGWIYFSQAGIRVHQWCGGEGGTSPLHVTITPGQPAAAM